MTQKQLRAYIFLLLTAAIWGFAFSAQSIGSRYLGTFTFNGIRFALGSVSLIPLIIFFNRRNCAAANREAASTPQIQNPARYQFYRRFTLFAGILSGIALFVGASLQQFGIAYTTAGNAGFITALYIVFVPIFGLVLQKTVPFTVWIGIILAVCGMYFLSFSENLSINFGDALMLIGAVFWAVHILLIDYFVKKNNALSLACIQFAVCAVFCFAGAYCTETATFEAVRAAFVPLLYGGLCSVGVAYTLQIVAQKDAPPAQAAVILSMETVFSAAGGALILGETLNARGYAGGALILTAIILAQIQPAKKDRELRKP